MFPPTPTLIPPLPPTVNGPITVALVGKLSQIVGNLQFMMFPQITPSGTCFEEKFSKFSTVYSQNFERRTSQKPGALFYYPRGWTGHILWALSIIQLWKFCDSKNLIDYNSPNFERRSLAVHCFTISEAELATFYDHCTSFNTAVYDRCISPTLNCLTLECVTKPIHL